MSRRRGSTGVRTVETAERDIRALARIAAQALRAEARTVGIVVRVARTGVRVTWRRARIGAGVMQTGARRTPPTLPQRTLTQLRITLTEAPNTATVVRATLSGARVIQQTRRAAATRIEARAMGTVVRIVQVGVRVLLHANRAARRKASNSRRTVSKSDTLTV